MKNDIILPPGTDSRPFQEQFNALFADNLSENLKNSIAMLLAIDYAARLSSKYKIEEHAAICARRLKQYIGQKLVLGEEFSSVMTFFAVALTPEEWQEDMDQSRREKSQTKEALIDSIITAQFGSLNSSQKELVRMFLQDSLSSKRSGNFEGEGTLKGEDGPERDGKLKEEGHLKGMANLARDGRRLSQNNAKFTQENNIFHQKNNAFINFIIANSDLFQSIIISAQRNEKRDKEILEFTKMHITKIMNYSRQLERKISSIKNIVEKSVFSASVLVSASIGLVIGGLALPLLVVPAIAAAVKYSPAIGQKLSSSIVKNSSLIQEETEGLNKLKLNSLSALNKGQNQGKSLEHSGLKEDMKDLIQDIITKQVPKRSEQPASGGDSSKKNKLDKMR
ncbi:MAG: hypothetical protein COA94_00400 [Rickettsiales bacterium]|nr:MAG: hypothetical protein COA94_00400 [Rickettsiales bacterium]